MCVHMHIKIPLRKLRKILGNANGRCCQVHEVSESVNVTSLHPAAQANLTTFLQPPTKCSQSTRWRKSGFRKASTSSRQKGRNAATWLQRCAQTCEGGLSSSGLCTRPRTSPNPWVRAMRGSLRPQHCLQECLQYRASRPCPSVADTAPSHRPNTRPTPV